LVASWDTAQKAGEIAKNAAKGGKTTSPWAGQLYGIYRHEAYLLDAYCDHHDFPDGERVVLSLAEKWGLTRKPHVLLIEDKSTGSTLIQRCKTDHRHLRLNAIAVEPNSDKLTRMAQESPALEAGRVRLPETASWLPEWEQAIFGYPMSVLDPGDALSQFLGWFRTRKVMTASGSVVGAPLPTVQS
jgi:predicted phage terminase large subunit-like protein